jgi:hypothetical protein
MEETFYVVWPGDPEATGPYRSRDGRIDIFDTRAHAESFLRRWIGDPDAKVLVVRLSAAAVDPVHASSPELSTREKGFSS